MISRSELHGAVQAYLQSLRTGTLAGGHAPAADQVSIAAGQGDIARWRSALHALPDSDSGRVQDLSRKVLAGSYHPSADLVAGQIMARWIGDRVSV